MKTLQEQQAKAWRLAPKWSSYISQESENSAMKPCCWAALDSKRVLIRWLFKGEINGWDWRDTLQSRKEFEEMKPTELDKEDFVPEVGQECEVLDATGPNVGYVRCEIIAVKKDYCFYYVRAMDAVGMLHKECFRPIKTQSEKRREGQINLIQKLVVSYSDGLLGLDGTASRSIAEGLHLNGCRMTRELTDDAIEQIYPLPSGSSFMDYHGFARAIAAYVTGSE